MKGVFIVSKNNNKYFYNDETGFMELCRERKNNISKNEEIKINKSNLPIKEVCAEDIKNYLFKGSGFKLLTLEVSQACNLRCKYCIFGDAYPNTRNHGNDLMNWDTAKKAVDYYMSLFKEIKHINPLRKPNIGFYGGEPLINFKLIKKVVEYINNIYADYNVQYLITTNGLLLTKEVSEFLVKNRFGILISLDGNKDNHDRNRIKLNGKGSFDEVFSNVKEFINNYPTYPLLTFSSCYDYKTNLIKMSEFICKNKLFVSNLTLIDKHDTNYYDRFTEDDIKTFNKNYNELENTFFDIVKSKKNIDCKDGLYMPLFGYSYLSLLLHSVQNQKPNPLTSSGGTCIPGEKLFVSVHGVLHMCERINNKFPIGDLNYGLDYGKISTIINNFNKTKSLCKSCNISRLCSMCFSRCTQDDKFQLSPIQCEKRELYYKTLITKFVNIMEENPLEFNKILKNHFLNLNESVMNIEC